MNNILEKCEVCGGLLDEEDLFCANCGTEAPGRAPQAGETSANWTHHFECQGCGASMSYSASAGSLACPFCGSTQLDAKADEKSLAPRAIVPLVVQRNEAEATLRNWLGRGWFRPGDLSDKAVVTKITPVYVPYWSFSAVTHTYYTADSSHTPAGSRASWYPVAGERRGNYAGLLVGASSSLTPAETKAICPFDLRQGVDPGKVSLQGMVVEQFRVPRKYARPLARAGLEELETAACTPLVPGRSRNLKVNVRIENMSSEPLLLPVWIMAYRYREQVYRFLINGQTGRSTGQAPVSWWKIGGLIAAVLIFLLILLLIIAGLQ